MSSTAVLTKEQVQERRVLGTKDAVCREFRKKVSGITRRDEYVAILLISIQDHPAIEGGAEYEYPVLLGPMSEADMDSFIFNRIKDTITPSPKPGTWHSKKHREGNLIAAGYEFFREYPVTLR